MAYRPGQTIVAGVTGGLAYPLAYPLAGTGLFTNAIAGDLADKWATVGLGVLLPNRMGAQSPYPGYIGWGIGQAVNGSVPIAGGIIMNGDEH